MTTSGISGNFRKQIIIAALLVIAAGGAVWYWQQQRPVNYLIPGVPYYGYYNHFFDAFVSRVTVTATILDYYGDRRYSLRNLMESQFYSNPGPYSTDDLEIFFKARGYKTAHGDPNRPALDQMRRFVNPRRNVPIVAIMKSSSGPAAHAMLFQVVIGVFDRDKKVVVHDFNFGNNFMMSYDDFQKRLVAGAFLAVWPSPELGQKIEGIDSRRSYPQRIPAMDLVGPLLAKRSEAVNLGNIYTDTDFNDSLSLYREITADPLFERMHPAARIVMYEELALRLIKAGKPDEAIRLIEEKVTPINQNLEELFSGWQVSFASAFPTLTKSILPHPWVVQANAYAQVGDLKKAREHLRKAIDINSGYQVEAPRAVQPTFQ